MIRRLAVLMALFVAAESAAQQPAPGCASPESKQFDFWLGEWDLSYKRPDGATGKSRSRVTKILDGCGVLEEFTGAPGSPLDGRSHSVYDRNAGRWKQTWVDNSGSYLDFAGGLEGDRMILLREAERQGKRFRQRMVWQDIRADALKWLWQRSDDGGASWVTLWEIDYRRLK